MTLMRVIPLPFKELSWRNPLVVVEDALLSLEECTAMVARIEALGPTAAPVSTPRGPVMRPDLRTNDRVMFDDPALARLLFERIRPLIPERLEGEWSLIGANERLRCYRYRPGQAFAPHFDGAFHRSADEVSLLTFLVYLSHCDAGGATRFLDLDCSIQPAPGRALVFNHHLLHEGCPVLAGSKYVVRSDLMFRRYGQATTSTA